MNSDRNRHAAELAEVNWLGAAPGFVECRSRNGENKA
jgi:hypothetical protein